MTTELHQRAAKNLKYAGCIDASDIEETVQILTAEYGPALVQAVEAEQSRWQDRIYAICQKVLPDVDGAGCESGDPLDVTDAEVSMTIAHLQDQAGMVEELARALRGALPRECDYKFFQEAWRVFEKYEATKQ